MNISHLEALAEAVMEEHLQRKDIYDGLPLPLRRRGKIRRPRPRTAIIALAAQESAAAREWAEQQADSTPGRP